MFVAAKDQEPRKAETEVTESCNVAFLGIDLIGGIMARRLIAAGFPTTLWDRSRDEAEAVASSRGTVAASPADAVRDAHVVLTMLKSNPAIPHAVSTWR